ncbi:MAG TPA: MFS transporter [Gaiellaceae bacterium]|nr:MFS transporter [Gaiellaceae bacterium]
MRSRILAQENRKWWTLGALSFALFMIMLDNTVVNVALPSIKADLGISQSELEWTVAAYALTFASLLLTGGKLGDLVGRRLIFVIGLIVFTTSSLLCGLSGSAAELIAARAVQGVGAALMMPATLSIITATFAAKERGTAIGVWAGVSAMALAIGPLLGGVITEHISWNWIFYVNVPIGVLGVVAAFVVVPESKDTSHEQRLDLPGLLTSGIGLFALVYALIEANQYGWSSTRILGLFAISAVALGAFVFLEMHQRLPMLDLSLFRNGTFAGANLVAILVTMAMFGIFVFFPLYMQTLLGWTPIQAGAALVPWTLMVVIFAPVAGKLSDRVGSRWLMAGGMSVVAVCCLLLSTISLHSSFWNLLPAFILGGVGMAFVMTPMSAAAMGAAPVEKAGVASGVLNTFRQVGVALGIGIMGAIVANRAASAIAGGATQPQAFVDGLTFGMRVSAAICLGGAAAAAVLVRKYRHAEPGRQEAPEAALQVARQEVAQ